MRQFSDFEANVTSVERINEYENTPHEVKIVLVLSWQNFHFALKDEWNTNKEIKLSETWPDKGHIKFIDYSVRYRDDLDFVLQSINCDIKPSEKVNL